MRKFLALTVSFITFLSFTQAQSQHNVLITGEGGQHDEEVKQSFLLGFSSYDGSEFDGLVDLFSNHSISQSFDYAENNGYDIIVQSTVGMSSYINIASQHPTVKLFMPSEFTSLRLKIIILLLLRVQD